VNAIQLPTAEPPLLVVLSPACHMVIVMRADAGSGAAAQKAVRIAAEIDWLLSRRASVRSGI
jgi:hypothetical protein